MNPNHCRVALRPRGPLEVFDLTLVFVRANRGVLARLAAAVLGPWLLVFAVACWLANGSPWLVLLPVPCLGVVQVPFTLIGGKLLFRSDATAWGALADAARAGRSLVTITLLGLAGSMVSAMSCGWMLLPTMAALLFVPESALLERESVRRVVERSQRLASAGFGAALFGVIARMALTVWGALVAEAAGQLLFDSALQLGQPFGALLTGQVTPFLLFGALAAQPLFALYRLLLYVDVRTRTEGWDLRVSLRAAAIARSERR